jgi:hypothetical protein
MARPATSGSLVASSSSAPVWFLADLPGVLYVNKLTFYILRMVGRFSAGVSAIGSFGHRGAARETSE